MSKLWTQEYIGNQDGFLESMAAAAQAVVDYFEKKEGIIYINVMNNMIPSFLRTREHILPQRRCQNRNL